jgi:hypothetical protein
MRVATMGDQIDVETPEVLAGPRCATVSGVNVHANVSVAARDRMGLERLCRYAGRPPVAIERLSLLPDARLLYRLKRRWRNGTTHVIFEPLVLIEKLAALVPAPRFNLVRYHGVFAPAARWRADIVPSDPPSDSLSHRGCRRKAGMGDILTEAGCLVRERVRSRPRNYSWAELLHRVFSIDVLECASCGGRLRIVAAIHPPAAIRRILDCLGIPSRAPPIAAASRDAADWKFSE